MAGGNESPGQRAIDMIEGTGIGRCQASSLTSRDREIVHTTGLIAEAIFWTDTNSELVSICAAWRYTKSSVRAWNLVPEVARMTSSFIFTPQTVKVQHTPEICTLTAPELHLKLHQGEVAEGGETPPQDPVCQCIRLVAPDSGLRELHHFGGSARTVQFGAILNPGLSLSPLLPLRKTVYPGSHSEPF
jgi:hypothetical protein